MAADFATRPAVTDVLRTDEGDGRYEVSATVTWEDGEVWHVAFATSTRGGPILLRVRGIELQVIPAVVERLGRDIDQTWVEGFYSLRSDDPE